MNMGANNMYADKYVGSAADVPKVEHYAIFESDSYYTEGDERSRTHPGHGYPGGTTQIIKYEAYLTKEKLLAAIKDKDDSKYTKKEYVVCKITPLVIEKTVNIAVK